MAQYISLAEARKVITEIREAVLETLVQSEHYPTTERLRRIALSLQNGVDRLDRTAYEKEERE